MRPTWHHPRQGGNKCPALLQCDSKQMPHSVKTHAHTHKHTQSPASLHSKNREQCYDCYKPQQSRWPLPRNKIASSSLISVPHEPETYKRRRPQRHRIHFLISGTPIHPRPSKLHLLLRPPFIHHPYLDFKNRVSSDPSESSMNTCTKINKCIFLIFLQENPKDPIHPKPSGQKSGKPWAVWIFEPGRRLHGDDAAAPMSHLRSLG